MQSVGFAFDGNDGSVVQKPVYYGIGYERISEDFIPLGKVDVRRYDCAVTLISSVNELEKEFGIFFGDWKIIQLVDNEQFIYRTSRPHTSFLHLYVRFRE